MGQHMAGAALNTGMVQAMNMAMLGGAGLQPQPAASSVQATTQAAHAQIAMAASMVSAPASASSSADIENFPQPLDPELYQLHEEYLDARPRTAARGSRPYT